MDNYNFFNLYQHFADYFNYFTSVNFEDSFVNLDVEYNYFKNFENNVDYAVIVVSYYYVNFDG